MKRIYATLVTLLLSMSLQLQGAAQEIAPAVELTREELKKLREELKKLVEHLKKPTPEFAETLNKATYERYLNLLLDPELIANQFATADITAEEQPNKRFLARFVAVSILLDTVWGATKCALRDTAWDAVRGAAWDEAWFAAEDVVVDAARDAAWFAAEDVVVDAARDAAWDEAWGAAWDAAWGAARNAAWGAARNAANDFIFKKLQLVPDSTLEQKIYLSQLLGLYFMHSEISKTHFQTAEEAAYAKLEEQGFKLTLEQVQAHLQTEFFGKLGDKNPFGTWFKALFNENQEGTGRLILQGSWLSGLSLRFAD